MMSRSVLQLNIAGRGRRHGIRRITIRQHALTAFIIFIVPFFSMGAAAQSTMSSANLSFTSLEMCSDSSYNMSKYGSEDVLAPCILYDIRDFSHSDPDFVSDSIDADNTSEITLVQVTPSDCNNHRDGAATAVKLLNANNDGMGIAIGYYQDHYVKFRLVSIVGGNTKNISDDAYREDHGFLLDSALDEIDNAHYILGTCSGQSIADKPIALKREKVLISQVGPPGFYTNVKTNPYVFGIHVNSDTYPLPALQALKFHLMATDTATSLQPVRVIYGNYAEFFYSTCRSVIDEAAIQEFDVAEIEYDPNTDDLESLADQLCPSTNGNSTSDTHFGDQLPPAIFACVRSDETNVILDRLRSNGCRPSSSWFTTATWQWASDNPDTVPYFQGAGQWHQNFKYSDNFFDSGQDVLNYGLDEFGYTGSYDHVVSYAIPNLIADLIQTFFRIDDFPDVADAFSNRYDDLRKALSFINAQTIFGPVSFNEYQRNSGRGAAGFQWIPASYVDTSVVSIRTENDVVGFVLGLTSPRDQADAAIIIPSPSGSTCSPGNYVNQTLIEIEPSLLGKKCSACPIDSYISEKNEDLRCLACPEGGSTMGNIGATSCFRENPNLIPKGLKSMGYLFVVISWSLAIGYIVWMIFNRKDSVIEIGQPEFLFFICVGAIISTSAIIPLTIAEADVGEDTTKASRNCQAIPFLYSLGWVLMYSSLTAKSYRLTKVAGAARRMQRLKITAQQMYKIIIAFLILDAIILIAWQVTDPLVYTRTEPTKSVDEDTGIVTLDTVGQCASNSLWKFFGPIIAIHGCLMVITNALLWRVRNMSDRYQEQKFVALASLYTCELLLLGVPIILVQVSAAARYIVIAGVIFLTDTGVLSLIFIPKIKFQNEGLPQGVSVIQSMNVHSSVIARQSRNNLQSSHELSRSIEEISRYLVSIDSDEKNDKIRDSTSKHSSVSMKAESNRDSRRDSSCPGVSTNLVEMNDENEH
jgi:hypothetical protein